VRRGGALFCLGMWVMGTICVSVVATQNFYTIERLLVDESSAPFRDGVNQLGAPLARDLLRYLSSELNRLFFQYWNYLQIPLGGLVLWLVRNLPNRVLRWQVVGMVGLVLVLAFLITPPIIAIGRSLDFVSRDTPPVGLSTFGVLHAAYTTLELGKAALGLWVAYTLCRAETGHS